jgi:hypothetical protein
LAATILQPGRSRRCCSKVRISSTSGFDVARDGRLLMVKPVDADGQGAPKQLVVVQNWFTELQQRVPTR